MRQYTQQFWIQGQDGKFEGSMPGVPKKEGTQDAVKTNKKPNAFLAKMRKKLAEHKKSISLVSDKDPMSADTLVKEQEVDSAHGVPPKGHQSDAVKENSSVLDTIRKRMELKRKNSASLRAKEIVEKAYEIAKKEMANKDVAYNKLVKDGFSPEGVDKYYHAVAHCKIARLGDTGVISSHGMGLGKELFDVFREHVTNVKPFSTLAKVKDSIEDMSWFSVNWTKPIHI